MLPGAWFTVSTPRIRDAGKRPSAGLFPEPFPIPHPRAHRDRQAKSELMRDHAGLSAVMGFVRNHVGQHSGAGMPGARPSVAHKARHAALGRERLLEQLATECGTFGECGCGLFLRASLAIKTDRDFDMRRREPNPLAADVVDMGEDRGDSARPASG